MDNIIMENNQLKQVPATASNATHDDDDDDDNVVHMSHAANTTQRESTTDIDVSAIIIYLFLLLSGILVLLDKAISKTNCFQFKENNFRSLRLQLICSRVYRPMIYRRCRDYRATVLRPILSQILMNHHTRRPRCHVVPVHKHSKRAFWNANVKKVRDQPHCVVAHTHTYVT